jgi:hypothetical protein
MHSYWCWYIQRALSRCVIFAVVFSPFRTLKPSEFQARELKQCVLSRALDRSVLFLTLPPFCQQKTTCLSLVFSAIYMLGIKVKPIPLHLTCFNCLVYRQLSANFMVVTTILFAHTTFLGHMLSDMFHTNR